MVEQNKTSRLRPIVLIAVAILAFIIIGAVMTSKHPQKPLPVQVQQHQHSSPESSGENSVQANRPRPKLDDIIRSATRWSPVHRPWYGKRAPNFVLTDITGKDHRLSDYRGKDVLIIFWATWCRPCLAEVPHLIALRNTESKDKLVMLAISNEHPQTIKSFAAGRKINYTVLIDNGTLPIPFSAVRAIPCSFFINPDGRIKLATEGMLSLGIIKAILRAE